MTTLSVKQQYVEIYGAERFEGELKLQPMLRHGAWICELYVAEDREALVFRLGHLDMLVHDGVDLLGTAQASGWNGEVAEDTEKVAVWTARERAWDMIHIAGRPSAEETGMLSDEADAADWGALEANLGRAPAPAERALFEKEFKRVLSDPTVTNQWPEG